MHDSAVMHVDQMRNWNKIKDHDGQHAFEC